MWKLILVHRDEQNTATYELQLAGVMIADYTIFAWATPWCAL